MDTDQQSKQYHQQPVTSYYPYQSKTEYLQESSQSYSTKKDPYTLSYGYRMGLSKQQLRKLEKKLTANKKKYLKEKEKYAQYEKYKKYIFANKYYYATPEYLLLFNSQKILLIPNTYLPTEVSDNILVTSALPYVNNVPHLGNIIGCVLSADVYARYKRLHGSNVLYICGTDYYGTATYVKGIYYKKTPQSICDHYHAIHSEVYKWFDIAFDYFGRTSTPWHTTITQYIFLNIHKAGLIKQYAMSQCYCYHCDLFLADRFIFGKCPVCYYEDARGDQCDKCQKLFNNPTEMVDYRCQICKQQPKIRYTVHFLIDLPEIQKKLEEWVDHASNKGKWSSNSITITKGWLNMGLKPKCITRDLKWGVSVPLDNYRQKVFYVWFDAPIGYISITANYLGKDYVRWWQSECVKLFQFMGKDNVPFHTVIFPSSLLASKQPWTLLHHISTTEYLTYEGTKFSKRNGTGVFGDSASTTGIPAYVWRYYLLINRPYNKDSDFSWRDFIYKNNNYLVANIGNICQRVLCFCFYNYKLLPQLQANQWLPVDDYFINYIKKKYDRYRYQLDKVYIKYGLKIAIEISSRGNKYLQDSKFWYAKNVADGRTQTVMFIICNFLRLQSLLLEPYMPSTSAKINYLLGLEHRSKHDNILGKILIDTDFKTTLLGLLGNSKGIKKPIRLFRKYTEAEMVAWQDKFKGKQGQ